MEICAKCGRPVADGTAFCTYCGQKTRSQMALSQNDTFRTYANQNSSPKNKTATLLKILIPIGAVLTTAAIVILLLNAFIDFNPVSQEEIIELEESITTDVYWTAGGAIFHTHEDCGHLANSSALHVGPVSEAIKAGKTRLCKTCQARDEQDEQ